MEALLGNVKMKDLQCSGKKRVVSWGTRLIETKSVLDQLTDLSIDQVFKSVCINLTHYIIFIKILHVGIFPTQTQTENREYLHCPQKSNEIGNNLHRMLRDI